MGLLSSFRRRQASRRGTARNAQTQESGTDTAESISNEGAIYQDVEVAEFTSDKLRAAEDLQLGGCYGGGLDGAQKLTNQGSLQDFLIAAQRAISSDLASCSSTESGSLYSNCSSAGHPRQPSPRQLVTRGPRQPYNLRFGSKYQPERFILVELFVSSACSSSAAVEADLQRQLQNFQPAKGDPVIVPIAYHVEYWNEGTGWADPFSLPESRKRQEWYRSHLQAAAAIPSLYTPQVLLGGNCQVSGTKLGGLLSSDQHRAGVVCRQLATINVDVLELTRARVVVEPHVECSEATLQQVDRDRLSLMVMVVDEGACDVSVQRGCNRGLSLSHVNIAAAWCQLSLKNFDGTCSGIPVGLNLPQAEVWSRALAVLVFLQDKRTGRVLGLCRHPLGDPSGC